MGDLLVRLQSALGDAYRIEKELGGGGMSRLFLATEASLHRQVVIKLLPPEFASEVSAARFRQEIEVAAHLQHTNILPVLTAGAKDDLLFYVMPFVSGESLRHRLTREGKLPVAEAVRILYEVADALAHAHAEGVIHRDIKPENILLLGTHAVLTDFGVARALAESRSGGRLTDTGLALGTPGYMSPEQAAGERNIDARADVYALAVVGYEMLAGFPPFAGPSAQAVIAAHLTATPRPLQDMRPETPAAVSNMIAHALAKDPSARLRTAAEFRDTLTAASGRVALPGMTQRVRLALVGGPILAIVALAVLLLRPKGKLTLDPNLVAVAPFDVLDSKLELWKEGLVDILSRNLDGAGPLRTVSPTVVVRRWRGRADPASATELGNRTGAGLAVFGQLVGTHGDSVRLTVTLYDVGRRSTVNDIEVRDLEASMDRLTDSLSVALLRELGRSRPIGAVRLGSLGSTSLPAIKAFLRAEQFYRRASWDSALANARRAVAIDSNFTLALRRISHALSWSSDTSYTTYLLREGARNHGLAPRESLLVTVDSLWGSTLRSDVPAGLLLRRLYSTVEEAVRRYPDDPEVWYHRGEVGFHWANSLAVPLTSEQTLESFERAIQLDSAFAPAYEHAVGLALRLRGPELARRYAMAELSGGPRAATASALRLVDQLLQPGGAKSTEASRMLDTMSGDALFEAWFQLAHWTDSVETAVRLARLFAIPRHGYRVRDSSQLQWILPNTLAYRGHLSEASRTLSGSTDLAYSALIFTESALLGAVPHDSAAAVFGRWLRSTNRWAAFGASWWATTGDTTSIRELTRRADSLARTAQNPADGSYWRYVELSTRPYLALAHHDTSAAIEGLESLPDSVCPGSCYRERLQLGLLLASQRRDREAAALLDRELYPVAASAVPGTLWALVRGRVNERLGNREKAIPAYRYVAAVWINADPELQPYVAEATAALVRLSGKPR